MKCYFFANDDFSYCSRHAQPLIDLGKEPVEIKECEWNECDICFIDFDDPDIELDKLEE